MTSAQLIHDDCGSVKVGSRSNIAVSLILLAALAFAPGVQAQLAGDNLAVLLFRILAFDRGLPARSPSKVSTVVVLYRGGSSASEARYKEVSAALDVLARKASISGMSVRVAGSSFSTLGGLEEDLVRNKASAVFICPGLEDSAAAIVGLADKHRVLSFADDDKLLRHGVGVAILRRDAKASVVVNLKATRTQGADLDSAFLKLVEVLR